MLSLRNKMYIYKNLGMYPYLKQLTAEGAEKCRERVHDFPFVLPVIVFPFTVRVPDISGFSPAKVQVGLFLYFLIPKGCNFYSNIIAQLILNPEGVIYFCLTDLYHPFGVGCCFTDIVYNHVIPSGFLLFCNYSQTIQVFDVETNKYGEFPLPFFEIQMLLARAISMPLCGQRLMRVSFIHSAISTFSAVGRTLIRLPDALWRAPCQRARTVSDSPHGKTHP